MKTIISIIFAALVLVGCNKDKIAELEKETATLQAENSQLKSDIAIRDSLYQAYNETLKEVYQNLANIQEKQGQHLKISKKLEEKESPKLKQEILETISSIDKDLKSSKNRVYALRKKIKDSELQNTSLNDMVEGLNLAIEEKEAQIQDLKTQTESLGIRVAEVEEELERQEAELEQQSRVINTAYYIVASEKELKEKGIIEEKGGLLGLRKTKKLAAGFDPSHFTETNISETPAISFNAGVKKVDVISPHNPTSYNIVQGEDQQTVLEILNPDEFWKIKYLVVVAKS